MLVYINLLNIWQETILKCHNTTNDDMYFMIFPIFFLSVHRNASWYDVLGDDITLSNFFFLSQMKHRNFGGTSGKGDGWRVLGVSR